MLVEGAPGVSRISPRLRALIRRYKGQLAYCYEKALREHPRLAGRLWVQVSPTETPSRAEAEALRWDDGLEVLIPCVPRKMRQWRYSGVKPGDLDVIVAFDFRRSHRPEVDAASPVPRPSESPRWNGEEADGSRHRPRRPAPVLPVSVATEGWEHSKPPEPIGQSLGRAFLGLNTCARQRTSEGEGRIWFQLRVGTDHLDATPMDSELDDPELVKCMERVLEQADYEGPPFSDRVFPVGLNVHDLPEDGAEGEVQFDNGAEGEVRFED